MSYKSNKKVLNAVNEPMVAYAVPGFFNQLYNILNGASSRNLSNDYDVLKLARKGFSKSELMLLGKRLSLNLQQLSSILHISERTLQRYADDAIIKTEYAEKAVELARLYSRGEEVFGAMDKFKLWIKTPAYIFNGEAPVSLLDTSTGFDMVFKELGRIEHGIFA